MDFSGFESIIKEQQTIHLSGIGGVSMRALARYLKHIGAKVRGSDRERSEHTKKLIDEGIPVKIGHSAENTEGAALVIRTAAIGDENPEISAARSRGTPILERAEAWGILMDMFGQAVCVAGTHGKTTTTAMIATVTDHAGIDPTVMVGGDLSSIGGTLRIGSENCMIAEACEYKNSFHSFRPTVAVILNIDRDHLDFFSGTEDILASFRQFAEQTPKGGTVVVNGDDKNAVKAVQGIDSKVITFGMSSTCDIYPKNITIEQGYYSCDVMHGSEFYARVIMGVPGLHNLQNALASAAVAVALSISGQVFSSGIAKYVGVGRRFEFKKHWRGAKVYDDYAHHPSEITASIGTARGITDGRVICLFQPHTYSRTVSLLGDFALSLTSADHCILCPIFAAREVNTTGISSGDLAALIPDAQNAQSFEQAVEILNEIVKPGDVILTMGAGDVYKISDFLL